MTLATALRQRALLHQHFKTPKLRVRNVQPRAARHPSAAAIAYLVGLRAIIDVVRKAIVRDVLPELPRLLAAHAATKPRTDSDTKRIAIVGAPRAGKTTRALELGNSLGLLVYHADDLIPLGWSEASAELARQMTECSSGIFEGVAVVRALRKMMGNGIEKPVDSVLILREPHVPLNDGQARMASACETILREIEPELRARGVELVYQPDQLLARERTDNTGDSAEDLFAQVTATVDAEVTPTRIALLAQQNALRVSEHTKTELAAQIKQVVKIDLFAPDTGIADNISAFVAQNVVQIKGLTDSAIKTAHATLLQGARDGLRVEEVAKQLKAGLKVSDKRAAFLAADQIGSLNGELTQLRQTSLGIKQYKWSTSNDEKVRHDHAILNATIQLWAKPPVVNQKTGFRANPGRDKRCRCSGIPVLDDLLQEAGLLQEPANDQQATPANDQLGAKAAPSTPATAKQAVTTAAAKVAHAQASLAEAKAAHAKATAVLEQAAAPPPANTNARTLRTTGKPGAGQLHVPIDAALKQRIESALAHGAVPPEPKPNDPEFKTKMSAHMKARNGAASQRVIEAAAGGDSAIEAKLWTDNWVGTSTNGLATSALEQLQKPGSWAQAHYQATQSLIESRLSELQAAGTVDAEGFVTLYRGISGEQAHAAEAAMGKSPGAVAHLPVRALSSWTTKLKTARSFGRVVVKQRIHYTRAFVMHALEAPTWFGESEWTIIAENKLVEVTLQK